MENPIFNQDFPAHTSFGSRDPKFVGLEGALAFFGLDLVPGFGRRTPNNWYPVVGIESPRLKLLIRTKPVASNTETDPQTVEAEPSSNSLVPVSSAGETKSDIIQITFAVRDTPEIICLGGKDYDKPFNVTLNNLTDAQRERLSGFFPVLSFKKTFDFTDALRQGIYVEEIPLERCEGGRINLERSKHVQSINSRSTRVDPFIIRSKIRIGPSQGMQLPMNTHNLGELESYSIAVQIGLIDPEAAIRLAQGSVIDYSEPLSPSI